MDIKGFLLYVFAADGVYHIHACLVGRLPCGCSSVSSLTDFHSLFYVFVFQISYDTFNFCSSPKLNVDEERHDSNSHHTCSDGCRYQCWHDKLS